MTLTAAIKQYLHTHGISPAEASAASVAGALTAEPTAVAEVLDTLAAESSLTDAAIQDHYRRVREVYDTLASLDGHPDAHTGGVIDNSRWYTYRPNTDDFEALDEGFDRVGSPTILSDAVRDLYEQSGGRVLYALTTYSPEMDQQALCRFSKDTTGDRVSTWRTDGPLPDYGDIVGQALIHDVDLADAYAERPLPAAVQTVVEAALDVYVDRFAALAGSRDHVFLLDSVGGAYPMLPPAATAPLAEEFPAEKDRALLFEALCTRMNEWLGEVWTDVCEQVPAAETYLDPDTINNKNRQYKPVLSVHKSIDGVVTPIDVTDVQYDHVPVRAVDEADIAAAHEWAASVTSARHATAIGSIIETLWPDYTADAETWMQALRNWLFDHERAQLQTDHHHAPSQEVSNSTAGTTLHTTERTLTTTVAEIKTALDDLAPGRVIEDTILGAGWADQLPDTQDRSGGNRRAFVPCWTATYNSANATFVVVTGHKAGVWYDSSNGYKGGPVEAALIAHADRSPSAGFASGTDWWEGLSILRQLGYEIPVWIPDATAVDGEQMPLWALRKFAQQLGIITEAELVERSSNDGSSYLGFHSDDYARVVRWAEQAGLNTGRTDHLDVAVTSAYDSVDLQAYTVTGQNPYSSPETLLAACLRARADGVVPAEAAPPTLALLPIVREAGIATQLGELSAGTRAVAMDVFTQTLGIEDVHENGTVTIYTD